MTRAPMPGDDPGTLDDLLITDELDRRPSRPPDHEAEARALAALAETLATNPRDLLQQVVEAAMAHCRADSAGISILEPGGEQGILRWRATAGTYAVHVNATMPREASPCGHVMRRGRVLLLARPERHFPALRGVEPPIHESLLAPWHVDGAPAGTLWVNGHGPERLFDAEDARVLASLARFAAAAWRTVQALEAVTDIDALKRSAEALRASEEHLRLIVEGARDYAIFTTDLDGRITDWTPGAEAVFGWSAAEAVGESVAVTFTGEDREAGVPEAERATARERGVASDVRWHQRRDGARVFIEGTTRALRDGRGALRGFLKVGQDLTARRALDEALRASETRYRTLVDNVRDYAIFLLDARGVIVEWPEGAERVKGYTAAEAVGQHLALCYTPEDVAAGVPAHELTVIAAEGRGEWEGWRVRKGGTRFWANEIGTAVRDDEGRLVGFTKISRDLTEQRLAEEATERAQLATTRDDLRRQLAAAEEGERRRLARELHDQLGQELTAFRLGLEEAARLAREREPTDVALLGRLDQLATLATRMTAGARYLALELRPPELDDLGLESALETFVAEWSARYGVAAEVAVTGDAAARTIPAEVGSTLYRIAQEALTNVAKHAGATEVSVIVEKPDGEVRMIVEDDGRGFDPEATVTRVRSERRLGLAGMRERAAMVGGTVVLESSPGGGTTLYVRLPVEDGRHDAVRDAGGAP